MRRALPYLIFALVTLAVFWNFLRSGQTLLSAPFLEMVLGSRPPPPPSRFPGHARVADNAVLLPSLLRVYNEGLKAGELRLWNPYLFCGYPVYADPMVHPFYPPHLILHTLLPAPIAFELSLMLHLFLAGSAMFWLMRILKVSEAGGTVAGLAWMLFGYNAMWFSTGILLGVSVFVPLALMWIVQGLERRDLTRAPRAALAMGMVILGSHPQHALHFFLFLLAWLLIAVTRSREGRSFVFRFAGIFAVLSVGVALVEVFVRLDSILQGYRKSGPDLEFFYGHALALLGQAVGVAVGRIQFSNLGTLDPEFNVYAGIVIFTLSLTGAVRCFKEPYVRFVALFGLGAFLVAFVRPLAHLWQLLPLLNLSPPSRWLCVFGFCLAVLAGRGFDSLSSGMGRIPHWVAASGGVLFILCLLNLGPLSLANRAAIGTLIAFAMTAMAAFVARRRPWVALPLALLSLLFELLLNFIGLNQHYDPGLLRNPPDLVRQVQQRQEDQLWRATGRFVPSEAKNEATMSRSRFAPLADNALSVYGVESLSGFEAIIPAHYIRYCDEAGGKYSEAGRLVTFSDFSSPLLDMAGLKYLFRSEEASPGDRFRLIAESGPVHVYENKRVFPRAYVVSGALKARDEDDAARLLHSSAFDARESVVLQSVEDALSAPVGAVPGKVIWIERTSDRLRLDVSAAESGWLVLSDTDYPGWQATIDGQRSPVYRANVAFRAVRISAGRHEVVFRFSPWTVRWGLAGSILSLAFAIAWIAVGGLRSGAVIQG